MPVVKQQRKKKKTSIKANNKPRVKAVSKQTPKSMKMYKQPTTVGHKAVSALCGLVDPFCVHANGAKYPDSSSNRTLAYHYKQLIPLYSDAAGVNNYLFSPQFSYGPGVGALVYSGSAVTSWGLFPASAAITGVLQYRIVSAGFRIKRIGAPLNASGILSIRIYPFVSNSTLATGVDVAGYNCTDSIDIPLQDVKDLVVVYPRTSQMPEDFYKIADESNVVLNTTAKGICPIAINITGAALSNYAFILEHVVNYELMFDDGNGLSQLATPSPIANPILTSAASMITSTIKPIVTTGITSFANFVVGRAKQALLSAAFGPAAGAGLAIMVD